MVYNKRCQCTEWCDLRVMYSEFGIQPQDNWYTICLILDIGNVCNTNNVSNNYNDNNNNNNNILCNVCCVMYVI